MNRERDLIEPESSPPLPPKIEFDQLNLARQIVASGGQVRLVHRETRRNSSIITQVDQFPQGPFALREVYWTGIDPVKFAESGSLKLPTADDSHGMTNETFEAIVNLLAPCSDLRRLGLQTRDNRVSDDALTCLGSLSQLEHVMIGFPQLSDAAVEDLKKLPNLIVIWLVSPRLSDGIWESLAEWKQLESIILSAGGSGKHSRLAGEGVALLADLTKLRKLSLQSTQLSEEGIRQISSLRQLEELDLYNSNLDDKQLESLKALENLKSLGLVETQVTETAVERFKEALPRCSVYF